MMGREEETMDNPNMVEKTFDATLDQLDDVLAFVTGRLEILECPMKKQIQIEVAVEELFVNIASYAYPSSSGTATVQVALAENPPAVEITLIDHGLPYNPLARPDPDVTLPSEERQIGGLGIYMAKKNMDAMAYEYRDGCNVLKLKKLIG